MYLQFGEVYNASSFTIPRVISLLRTFYTFTGTKNKKLPYIISLALIMLSLPACQRDLEIKNENRVKALHQQDAASYNTQLGLAYLKQGDTPRAKRKMLNAMRLAPDSPDVNSAMGFFLEKTRNLKDADIFYKKAIALAPTSGAHMNNYGTFLCREGHYQEAESYFLQAVLDPQYIQSAGAYENAGLCAAAIPDENKAVYYFKKALEQDHERKQSLSELASIELKRNHPEQALSMLQKYQQQTLQEPVLLAFAIDAAHQVGKVDVEKTFKEHLIELNRVTEQAGEKNEYDSNIG